MKHAIAFPAVLLLACASSVAAAPDTPPRSPPRADACKPTGKVLFEIDRRVTPGVALNAQPETSTIQVFASGAWTRQGTNAGGKAQAATSGCLDSGHAKELAAALRGAPWKVTTARIHCMAVSTTFTEYRVEGKLVFTERLCSGQSLDDKSRAALDAAVAEVEAAAKPAP